MGWAKLSPQPGVKRSCMETLCKLWMHQSDEWRVGRGFKVLDSGESPGSDLTAIDKDG